MILLSHPTGTQSVRALLDYLSANGLLAAGTTSLAFGDRIPRWLPRSIVKEMGRRRFDEARGLMRQTQPWRELLRSGLQRTRLGDMVWAESGWWSTTALYAAHDRLTARMLQSLPEVKLVYAYDDGAEATFREARACGIATAYECPTSHWRTWSSLYEEEADLVPEWAETLPRPVLALDKARRKDTELSTADIVFCASNFARQSLSQNLPTSARVVMVPYGAPPVAALPATIGNEPRLRVLYVGRISQTKGLSYLSAAVAELAEQVELTLVGLPTNPGHAATRRLLEGHAWTPSLSHGDLLACMRRHDVLVLPSLSEGFGLVMLEAMSQGLPVIGTVNSAAPDILSPGADGYVVPIRSSEAIRDALHALRGDRAKLKDMGRAAWETAKRHRWADYAEAVCRHAVGVAAGGRGGSPAPNCKLLA